MVKTPLPKSALAFNIYRHAERFRIASRTLRTSNDPVQMAIISGPAIVLSAFSCELFLKCLLAVEKGAAPPRGHNLKALFRDLSVSRRARLRELWDAYTPQHEVIWSAGERLTGQRLSRDLGDVLDEGARGFEKTRYAYEDGSFNFRLTDFPDMLRTVLLEVRPEWASIPIEIQPLPTSLTR